MVALDPSLLVRFCVWVGFVQLLPVGQGASLPTVQGTGGMHKVGTLTYLVLLTAAPASPWTQPSGTS